MKTLVIAGLTMMLSAGIAAWFAHSGFSASPAWNHKALSNVHEASLMVGVMLADERHAYETGLKHIAAQHERLENYTIHDVMILGSRVLEQRHAGVSEIEINERADLDSAIKLMNAKREVIHDYKIEHNRLVVTINDGLSETEQRFAKEELRGIWAVSYNQRHHGQGPSPVFSTTK